MPATAPDRRLTFPSAALAALVVVMATAVAVTGDAPDVAGAPLPGGTITGHVFRDYDASGTATGVEPGEPGLQVTAVCVADSGADATVGTNDDVDGAPTAPVTTDAAGNYTLAVAGSPCRVELTIPAGKSFLKPGVAGGTSLQFAAAGSVVDFAVWNPGDYCSTNPTIFLPCFAKGDNTAAKGVVSFDATTPFALYPTTGSATLAVSGDVGAVYGNAVRYDGQEFLGTYVKRHTDYGPEANTNAIYRFDTSTGAVSTFATLPGTLTAHDATGGYLSDDAVYDRVGREGIGDVDLSEDQNTLYAVDLGSASLVSIPIVGSGAATTAGTPTTTAIPAPAGCDGAHPMGLGVRDGLVYVGGVCGADSTASALVPAGDPSQLLGYVYTFDGSAFSATPALSFALNYPRGCAWFNFGTCKFAQGATDLLTAEWRAWSAQVPTPGSANFAANPQPMLANVEVLDGGRLLLSLRDRYADQQGNGTEAPGLNVADHIAVAAGDQLLACPNAGGTLVLENAGSCGSGTPYFLDSSAMSGARIGVVATSGGYVGSMVSAGAQPQNASVPNEGPGGAKVYAADGVIEPLDAPNGNRFAHDDTMTGSAGVLRRTGEILATSYDQGGVWQQGVTRWSPGADQSGGLTVMPTTYNDPQLFGKGNGLGDLAMLCDRAPVQIGNRVWRDLDGDGVQGPSEPPIAGVTVHLYDAAGATLVGTAVTGTDGTYVFDSSIVEAANGGGAPDARGGGLAIGTAFVLKLDNPADYSDATKLKDLTLTAATAGADRDVDSNAAAAGGSTFGVDRFPVVTVAAHGPGQNDHTFDVGFVAPSPVSPPSPPSPPGSGTPPGGPTGSIAGRVYVDGTNVPLAGVTITVVGTDVLGNRVEASTVTGADGTYLVTGLPAGTYTVTESQPDGYRTGTVTPTNVATVTLAAGESASVNYSETARVLPATGVRPNDLATLAAVLSLLGVALLAVPAGRRGATARRPVG